LIFIFNGPPGSGKDEACRLFKQKEYKHLSFKYHLFRATVDHFYVSLDWFMQNYENRSVKERPENRLNGFSRREALIHVSENIIKPAFGKEYFGLKAAEEMEPSGDYCFSDGGFQEEIVPIINKLGAENIILVQLTREGCDFSSDSRRYINGTLVEEFILGKETPVIKSHILEQKFPIKTYRVHNNAAVQDFRAALEKIHEKEFNAREINKEKGESN
jgi:hypothetical protein